MAARGESLSMLWGTLVTAALLFPAEVFALSISPTRSVAVHDTNEVSVDEPEVALWHPDPAADHHGGESDGSGGRRPIAITAVFAEPGMTGGGDESVWQSLEATVAELQSSNAELEASMGALNRQLNKMAATGDQDVRRQLREHQAAIEELLVAVAHLKVSIGKQPEALQRDKAASGTELIDDETPSTPMPTTLAQTNEEREALSVQLYHAAAEGDVQAMRQILVQGAEVNHRPQNGYGPLHAAAGNGHLDAVRLLIASGATVDAADDGESTPLNYAAWMGHVRCVEALAKAGADVNHRNKFGHTPLRDATVGDHKETVLALLALGADPSVRDDQGNTAHDLTWSDALRELLPAYDSSELHPSQPPSIRDYQGHTDHYDLTWDNILYDYDSSELHPSQPA